MPVVPVTAQRFRDLVLAVAEYLGCASYGTDGGGKAAIPTDDHDLAMCQGLVNTGFRTFVSASPRWQFLHQEVELTLAAAVGEDTVAEDTSRYRMPWFFNGVALRDWQFATGSFRHPIRLMSNAEVMAQVALTSRTSGIPFYCAFRRLKRSENAAAERRGWEAIFAPAPCQTLVVNTTVRAYPNGLQDLDDFHFAGPEFDAAIEAACLAQAEAKRQDRAGVKAAEYQQLLKMALALDAESAPKSVGLNLDPGEDVRQRHAYRGVDSYNGEPLDPAT